MVVRLLGDCITHFKASVGSCGWGRGSRDLEQAKQRSEASSSGADPELEGNPEEFSCKTVFLAQIVLLQRFEAKYTTEDLL